MCVAPFFSVKSVTAEISLHWGSIPSGMMPPASSLPHTNRSRCSGCAPCSGRMDGDQLGDVELDLGTMRLSVVLGDGQDQRVDRDFTYGSASRDQPASALGLEARPFVSAPRCPPDPRRSVFLQRLEPFDRQDIADDACTVPVHRGNDFFDGAVGVKGLKRHDFPYLDDGWPSGSSDPGTPHRLYPP